MTNNNHPVDSARLQEFTALLQRYKSGKASIERRAVAAENWWKLRNSAEERRQSEGTGGFQAVSGWLHNVIVSKHADVMEAYPEPIILPREPEDSREAWMLKKIIPVILEQSEFEKTWSDCMWQKLKTGTGVYKVCWDPERAGGLGDIAIERIDLLNVFWEPGLRDIQLSPCFFHTSLEDKKALEQQYPELSGRLNASAFAATSFVYDDAVSNESRATVIEVYYKKRENGRNVLHYCKYVGDCLLYSSENEGQPIYSHGLYPFVFDALFPVEGSPCGYGYIDLCRNAQTQIDMMQTAFIKNVMVGALPRYFQRMDGAVNEEEFLNLANPIIHVSGNLGEDSLRTVDYKPLSASYLEMRQSVINELRETSGNTETAVGISSSGVTAASAIAALQEASGKGSRDATKASYRAYGKIIHLCIELIREFYELPRQFRITGEMGQSEFVSYSNLRLRPQSQNSVGGVDMGLRAPLFDIRVSAQKQSSYTKLTQNELALQLYKLGFFRPEQAAQALCCMSMMDFEGREELMQQLHSLAAAALPRPEEAQNGAHIGLRPGMMAMARAESGNVPLPGGRRA